MPTEKTIKLAAEALWLKQAWLLSEAFIGELDKLDKDYLSIPKFHLEDNKWLKRYILEIREDLEDNLKRIFTSFHRSDSPKIIDWFAGKYIEWWKVNFGILEIGRMHEIESLLGKLKRGVQDFPPYSQLLLQNYKIGVAFRHPEYHLAGDLALQYNLFLDSEKLLKEASRRNELYNSEYSQSLGRSVILTCFNLLESFTSGLAAAYILDHPEASADVVKKLTARAGLQDRFLIYPGLISGTKVKLDDKKAPFDKLFGECKTKRDSFVHCEPGPAPSRYGYVKETHFHDISSEVVTTTVDLTCQSICLAWKSAHGKEGPSWLPAREKDGRFPKITVTLNGSVLAESVLP